MQRPRLKLDGPRVRTKRMGLGLEIEDVATRVGISRSFLSRIELHSVAVRPRTHKALRSALSCDDESADPDDLLAGGEDEIQEE
jgi:transcriptional regulator with XRE-family HTH domain